MWNSCVLGPLFIFLVINDFNQATRFCKIHHFPNDTNLLCVSNSYQTEKLSKLVNADLKYLVNWLNANKISFNVEKAEVSVLTSSLRLLEASVCFVFPLIFSVLSA